MYRRVRARRLRASARRALSRHRSPPPVAWTRGDVWRRRHVFVHSTGMTPHGAILAVTSSPPGWPKSPTRFPSCQPMFPASASRRRAWPPCFRRLAICIITGPIVYTALSNVKCENSEAAKLRFDAQNTFYRKKSWNVKCKAHLQQYVGNVLEILHSARITPSSGTSVLPSGTSSTICWVRAKA